MKYILNYIIPVFLLVSTSLFGQKSKVQVTEQDYHLWGTMNVEQLSDAGKWVSYSLHYESNDDTLFVNNTKTAKSFNTPGGTNGNFVGERFFICQNKDGQLIIRNLLSGKQFVKNNVNNYHITRDRKAVVYYCTRGNSSQLVIRNLEAEAETTIANVDSYSFKADSNMIIYGSGSELFLTDIRSNEKRLITKADESVSFSDFVWHKNGNSVAYFIDESKSTIGYYNLINGTNSLLQNASVKDNLGLSTIESSFSAPISISNDGTMVFFATKPHNRKQDNFGVQLWNTADKSLYPEKVLLQGWSAAPKVAVWHVVQNSIKAITDNDFPNMALTGDQKYALLFNPILNEPQFKRDAPIDFYLRNLITNEQDLFLAKQSPDFSKLSLSLIGKYIAYFRDSNWWVFNIETREHTNLTSEMGIDFRDENYNRSGDINVAGMAGWTSNDEAILLYDTYDVWLFKCDGSGYKRLTNGRQNKIVYRVIPQNRENENSGNFNWNQKGTFDIGSGLLIKGVSESNSGFYNWNEKSGMEPMVINSNRLGAIKFSERKDVAVYTEENYHISPRIRVKIGKADNLLYASNSHQSKYDWGFSKLISYSNSKGELLKAALFYPASYTPDKNYPMVVHIYEMQSSSHNKYSNPSMYNYDGFNVSNFTSQGYFVLLPDIKKIEGDPGSSAVDCVISAVREVLAHEPVGLKQIGLIGHSFGGYETNFIITQTDLFAAAISGSGIADVVSDYLYVSGNTSKQNGWRYEFDQASIGKSLFDDYEAYIRNSPITYAKDIQTPLLLWTGDRDKTVNPLQSIEMHLALRRLQKLNVMLIYEGDTHNLGNKNHQKDLSNRMLEWCNYFLKGGNKPDWLNADKL